LKKVFETFNHQLALSIRTDQEDHRTLENLKKTQDYVADHYDRSMTRKSGFRRDPDYLGHFKYKREPSLEDKYQSIKKGEYDFEKEEI